MKIRPLLICAGLIAASPGFAANSSPPSDASIEQLLTVTNVRQLLVQMKGQLDTMMAAAMREAQQGQTLTPERQAVIDKMKAKMEAVVNETLSWDTLDPIYIRTYRESLTQDELNGILAFYSSPAGQAYVKKMPVIMQNVMGEMQSVIKPMQHKIVEIQQQAMEELKSLKSTSGG